MVGGRRKEVGIGGFPTVTLSQARERARQLRDQIRDGIDPVERRREAKIALKQSALAAFTFKKAAEAYILANQASWKNDKHVDQWRYTLEAFAYPVLGDMPVQSVETPHVISVLEPIWLSKTVTASRLRGRIEAVLDWARVAGYRSGENPARWKGHLALLLATPNKVNKRRHHPALPYVQMDEFLISLRKVQGSSSLALQFAIHTACRSGEVRFATWDEIDLKERIWCIPATRMKAGKEHRVPLNDPAMAVLELAASDQAAGYVFPSSKGSALSDMAMTSMLRRMHQTKIASGESNGWIDDSGQLVTAHGFRSTFRDWAGEVTSHPREVIEHALAHQLPDKAEAAYARSTLLGKRRLLMDDWGIHCGGVSCS